MGTGGVGKREGEIVGGLRQKIVVFAMSDTLKFGDETSRLPGNHDPKLFDRLAEPGFVRRDATAIDEGLVGQKQCSL